MIRLRRLTALSDCNIACLSVRHQYLRGDDAAHGKRIKYIIMQNIVCRTAHCRSAEYVTHGSQQQTRAPDETPRVPDLRGTGKNLQADFIPWAVPPSDFRWKPRPAMSAFLVYLREVVRTQQSTFVSQMHHAYKTFKSLPPHERAHYEQVSFYDEQRFAEEMATYTQLAEQKAMMQNNRADERRTINTHVAGSIGSELALLKFGADEGNEEDGEDPHSQWALD